MTVGLIVEPEYMDRADALAAMLEPSIAQFDPEQRVRIHAEPYSWLGVAKIRLTLVSV